MSDELSAFLEWIYFRLIDVHGENKNFDYMHKMNQAVQEVAQLEARILDEVRDAQAERKHAVELEAENEALRRERTDWMVLLAMIIDNNGGELTVHPVLMRGDEEIVKWDDGLDLRFKLKDAPAGGLIE